MDHEMLNWAIAGAYQRWTDSMALNRPGWRVDYLRYECYLRIALLADPEVNLT